MRKLLFLSIFVISFLSNGQSSNDVYNKILDEIKLSDDFQKYNSSRNKEYKSFKVSPYLNSICENFYFFKKHIENYLSYCIDFDIISDEVLIRKENKKLSGNKRKTHEISFSETVNNYIAVEVRISKWGHESLLYLFKVNKGSNVELLFVETLYYN